MLSAFYKSAIVFRDDKEPSKSDIVEMLAVIQILEAEGVLCCAIVEPALIYHSTGMLYPKLSVYAQSLRDIINLANLR